MFKIYHNWDFGSQYLPSLFMTSVFIPLLGKEELKDGGAYIR
jgi:hypothetical protein